MGADVIIPDKREIIVVLGRSGYGKSSWTKQYVQGLSRLCVWDPKKSYLVDYPYDLSAYWEDEGPHEQFRIGGYYPEQAEILGSIAFEAQRCALILEECGILFQPRTDLPEWARECIYIGREREVSVIAIAQRPRSINVVLRSQATRIVTFQQREPKDLEWLDECFDPDDILSLDRLECLDFDVNTSEVSRYRVSLPSGNTSHKSDVTSQNNS
ncbi:MAG: hypothetical protein KGL39_39475 [Patescibacteria group bacterium]|nr:hypothetical protein [Patescibacteria group bacterium]